MAAVEATYDTRIEAGIMISTEATKLLVGPVLDVSKFALGTVLAGLM